MSFTCFGKRNSSASHQHESVYEAKVCHGLVEPVAPTSTSQVRYATPRQLGFIQHLGGDKAFASTLSVEEASEYIANLKRGPSASKVGTLVRPAPTPPPPPAPRHQPYESKVPLAMFDMVPDGYFAWRPDETADLKFIRISRRKSGKLNGARIVQTQHSDLLSLRWALWPSGKVSVYMPSVEDTIIGVIIDHKTAARTYAKEMGRCARCNKHLTDERSRHYSIGPECEKFWFWMIEEVDDEHDGRSFEELREELRREY